MNIVSSDGSILISSLSPCEYDLTVPSSPLVNGLITENTSTITLGGTGVASSKLSGTVKISNNPDNLLSVDSIGLLVLPPSFVNTDEFVKISNSDTIAGYLGTKLTQGDNITLTVDNNQGVQTLKISASYNNVVESDDTPTLNLFGQGTSGFPIYGNVRISNASGNQLVVDTQGLYVSPNSIQTPITPNDTATVSLNVSGTNNHTLAASVKISANTGNQLSSVSDGLFVAAPSSVTETPLSATSSSTLNLSTSGTAGHSLTGNVKISTSGGNALVDNSGLYVAQYKTALNGLTESSSNILLGGSLTQNTLINGNFDLAFANRKVVIGNLYNDIYGDANLDANVRPFFVRQQSNVNDQGFGAASFYGNLALNGVTAMGSGRGYVAQDAALKLTITNNMAVPISSVLSTSYNVLQPQTLSPGDITTSVNRPIGISTSCLIPLSGYTGNTSKIQHIAAFVANPIFQTVGGTNFTEITSYSGLFLCPSDEALIESSKVVNKYGVNQVGSSDANIFKGNISYYGTLTNASDARIKEQILNFDKGLDIVKNIRVVDFEYSGDYKRPEAGKQIGVIAQELESILPEAVQTINEGTFTDFRTVNQSVLTFVLINAVKQLAKEIEELKNK